MRKKLQRTYRDTATGAAIAGATVTVYLAGVETLATIYDSIGGGSVPGSVVTTDADGEYIFFVAQTDYDSDQQFKVVIQATGYSDKTVDNITLYSLDDAPVFLVTKSGDQTGIVQNTWTTLTWETEIIDTRGCFASNVFTPTIPGIYHISCTARFTTLADGSLAYIRIRKNGVSYKESMTIAAKAPGNIETNIDCLVSLDGVADYVDAQIYHSDTGDKIVVGAADKVWFQGFRVGV